MGLPVENRGISLDQLNLLVNWGYRMVPISLMERTHLFSILRLLLSGDRVVDKVVSTMVQKSSLIKFMTLFGHSAWRSTFSAQLHYFKRGLATWLGCSEYFDRVDRMFRILRSCRSWPWSVTSLIRCQQSSKNALLMRLLDATTFDAQPSSVSRAYGFLLTLSLAQQCLWLLVVIDIVASARCDRSMLPLDASSLTLQCFGAQSSCKLRTGACDCWSNKLYWVLAQ